MNFKAIYDAVNAANGEAQAVAVEIESLIEAGEVEQALAKETELDAATAKADKLANLYEKMTAAGSRDVAALFAPDEPESEADAPKTMPRDEYNALPQNERNAFVKGGGRVIDQE